MYRNAARRVTVTPTEPGSTARTAIRPFDQRLDVFPEHGRADGAAAVLEVVLVGQVDLVGPERIEVRRTVVPDVVLVQPVIRIDAAVPVARA